MTLAAATQNILFGHSRDDLPGEREIELLDEGLAHVDFGDPSHVFVVHIQLVPRRRLPVQSMTVAEVGDVQVAVSRVTIDNYVTIAMRGSGPSAVEARDQYERGLRASRLDPSNAPPRPPAERLTGLKVAVHDDLGTRYELRTGAAGQTDPWELELRYLPTPPQDARTLTLRIDECELITPLQ